MQRMREEPRHLQRWQQFAEREGLELSDFITIALERSVCHGLVMRDVYLSSVAKGHFRLYVLHSRDYSTVEAVQYDSDVEYLLQLVKDNAPL